MRLEQHPTIVTWGTIQYCGYPLLEALASSWHNLTQFVMVMHVVMQLTQRLALWTTPVMMSYWGNTNSSIFIGQHLNMNKINSEWNLFLA